MFYLKKWNKNPIISPGKNYWENAQTFNPGAVLLEERVHILYRAIGVDQISRIGYASSKDCLNIDERLDRPIYEHRAPHSSSFILDGSGGGVFGAEDPRLVKIENTVYLTYTFYDGKNIQVMLTEISVSDFLEKKWNWKKPISLSPSNVYSKNWVLFPEKIGEKYAILHSISPEIGIAYLEELRGPVESKYERVKGTWEDEIRGVAAPPIKTENGWLLLYHATKDGKYVVGAMLLDLESPNKILYKSRSPILKPEKEYELNGFKPGVVYATGAVLKNSKLFVYYGASDTYVCVAYSNLDELLDFLQQ